MHPSCRARTFQSASAPTPKKHPERHTAEVGDRVEHVAAAVRQQECCTSSLTTAFSTRTGNSQTEPAAGSAARVGDRARTAAGGRPCRRREVDPGPGCPRRVQRDQVDQAGQHEADPTTPARKYAVQVRSPSSLSRSHRDGESSGTCSAAGPYRRPRRGRRARPSCAPRGGRRWARCRRRSARRR